MVAAQIPLLRKRIKAEGKNKKFVIFILKNFVFTIKNFGLYVSDFRRIAKIINSFGTRPGAFFYLNQLYSYIVSCRGVTQLGGLVPVL